MSSCNFFLPEFEEMKSCIYRVETANAGMGLQWFWHHLFTLLLEKIVTFTTKNVCKIKFLTRVCNHFPMLTLQLALLLIFISKSVNVKSWDIVRGKEPRYRYLSSGIRLIICWRETSSFFDTFSKNTQLVNYNRRHLFSQYNEFSNVFCGKGKV